MARFPSRAFALEKVDASNLGILILERYTWEVGGLFQLSGNLDVRLLGFKTVSILEIQMICNPDFRETGMMGGSLHFFGIQILER